MTEQYYLDLIERLLNGAQYSGDDSLCAFCNCRLPWNIHQPKEHEPDCPYIEALALVEKTNQLQLSEDELNELRGEFLKSNEELTVMLNSLTAQQIKHLDELSGRNLGPEGKE